MRPWRAAFFGAFCLWAAPAFAQTQGDRPANQAGTGMAYGYLLTFQQIFDACFAGETELRRDIDETVALIEAYIMRTKSITRDALEAAKRRLLAGLDTPADVQAACRGDRPSSLSPMILNLQAHFAADPVRFRQEAARGWAELREWMGAQLRQPEQNR